jgi:Fe-S oxidoreductase/nitrate reductase gamma subunit
MIYPLSVFAFAALGYGMYRRYSLWRLGQPAVRNDHALARATSTLKLILGHGRILRRRRPGLMHLLIFWGMAALIAGTIIVALQADFGMRLLQGRFYLFFKLAMDTAGLGVLIGLMIALHRRYLRKEESLDNQPGDGVVLALLTGIIATGFFVESLRIAATGDPWGAWSPVGNILAGLFHGTSHDGLNSSHKIAWGMHASLSFGLIGYAPYSKLIHVFTAPLNTYFRSSNPTGMLAVVDIDNDEITRFGVGALEDFTWKDLLDSDACVGCDRCQSNCPAYATAKPLSPKKLIRNLRVQMTDRGRSDRAGRYSVPPRDIDGVRSVPGDRAAGDTPGNYLLGGIIDEDALWACTTCGSCMEQCPVFVEHIPKIVEMRRNQVLMESRFPAELNPVFRNMEYTGNPWGLGQMKRADWANGLDVDGIAKGGEPEYLYWVGCAGSFDDRNRRVATAMVGILNHAGVEFAILGSEEKCCGDSVRRLGNEYLFQSMVHGNMEILRRYGIKKVITQCPHCYNTLKNEYPQFGGNYEVTHHTEFISRLIGMGRIRMKGEKRGTITYQDPCYLGRHNGIYRSPRDILNVSGYRLAEMRGSSQESFCCGAGGGRIWMEECLGERINVKRTEDALAVNPESIVTACPYCLTMMEDGVKLKNMNEQVRTVDLAELVVEAIG